MAWLGLWSFWLWTTHGFHPTFSLAIVVTSALILAYAAAAYLNHLILIPRYWRTGLPGRYVVWLTATMLLLTSAALAVIRLTYHLSMGPDADPYGAYKHFVIDFIGMAVHLAVAAWVVRVFCRIASRV